MAREYVPDNYDRYRQHEAEQHRKEQRRLKCAWCGEPIYADRAYRIERQWVCPDCIEDTREWIDEED